MRYGRVAIGTAIVGWSMLASVAIAATPAPDPKILGDVARLTATRVEQGGKLPEGATEPGVVVLSNEPDAPQAFAVVEFDLSSVRETVVPLARMQILGVAKLKVKRPGHSASPERSVVHVLARTSTEAEPTLVTTMPAKLGSVGDYVLDVTSAVNEVLARRDGAKTLRLEVHLSGKPLYYEVLGLPIGTKAGPVTLDVVSDKGWTDDWQERLAPITTGDVVYREACLPLAEAHDEDVAAHLLYPAKRVVEVVRLLTGEKLKEGKDWALRDGKVVFLAKSPAIQFAPEFFALSRTGKDGTVTTSRGTIQLMEGTWYQERQIEVTYEPTSRDWQMPAPLSSLADLPRTKKLLESKSPIKVILFGDSISAGGNASKYQGGRPWQPSYGDLVARKLRATYDGPITYMNHSRGGATSGYALGQADSQVAWFEPDLVILAYGMNDRGDGRRQVYRENLEKIIDTVRARAPECEFVVVTPMLNSPKQSTGLEPVLFVRDEALKIAKPGLAFVDVTTTHQKLLERKEYLDTSGNGANHPNDFLQRVYAQRVLEVLLP